MTAARGKDVQVLVRRDPDGKVFSEVRDLKASPDPRRYVGSAVVIDRQRGTGLDADSVISRAQSLAAILDLPIDLDLTQQCRNDLGWAGVCNCERCVEKRNRRATK